MRKLSTGVIALSVLVAAHVALHLATASNYGMFRDEFYYIDCARHLDWGYVDHPPLSIAVLAGSLKVFGDSQSAVRLVPALIGGLMIVLAWLIAGELGGGGWAKFIAAFAMFFCPQFTGITGYYSMNSFDYLFWALGSYLLIRILRTDNRRLWLWFGAVAGLGLMNKISVLFFLFGMGAGLLLTKHRRYLISGWFWAGAGVAALLFLPHVLWQISKGWPTLEFMSNAQKFKMAAMNPVQFILGVWMDNNPVNVLVWLPGLVYLFFIRQAERFKAVGWLFSFVLALLIVQKGKPYYMAPALPVLFAAGGVALELCLSGRWKKVRPHVISAITVGGLISLPFCLRILPVKQFIAYQKMTGIRPSEGERHEFGALPQFYADHFGWENMAKTVSEVYKTLTPEQKKDCVVYGRNYGEAGAINYFRKKYELPKGISEHNNHFLWGPGPFKGGTIIFIGVPADELREEYAVVEERAVIVSEYAMPYETNLPVCVCSGLKIPIKEAWGPPRYI
jgi:hypothetical protein